MTQRVVFDTTTVLSALLFANDRLAWLREHWRGGNCTPLISRATVSELTRILAYPKFRLTPDDRQELLADYLPYCEVVDEVEACAVVCRDQKDQPFLDLTQSGNAAILVRGDQDLLVLAGQTSFVIESPSDFVRRSSRH